MKYIKQKAGQPHFEDLVWNRPINKAQQGNILIIGGHTGHIMKPSQAYESCLAVGVNNAKVLLPSSTKKVFFGNVPSDIEFCEATPTGSFSKSGYSEIMSYITSSDLTLLAGDWSQSSETALLLEKVLVSNAGLAVLANDTVSIFSEFASTYFDNEHQNPIILVLDFSQLQLLLINAGKDLVLKTTDNLDTKLENVSKFSQSQNIGIVLLMEQMIITAIDGQIATTAIVETPNPTTLASKVAVWLMQNPKRPFEALTTAVAS